MGNEKPWIITANGMLQTRPESAVPNEMREPFSRPGEATLEESQRLIRAFWRIRDPNRRAWLLDQVERMATLKSTMS